MAKVDEDSEQRCIREVYNDILTFNKYSGTYLLPMSLSDYIISSTTFNTYL